MSTLRTSVGGKVHALDMRNQLNVSLGGYFMLAQMLSFTQASAPFPPPAATAISLRSLGLLARNGPPCSLPYFHTLSPLPAFLYPIFRGQVPVLMRDLIEPGPRSDQACRCLARRFL